MATNRRALQRQRTKQLSPAAVEAWLRCDYGALHAALGLGPCERSPLPLWLCALGVYEGETPDPNLAYDRSFDKALSLQRELIEAVGLPAPDAMRRTLEEKLEREIEYRDHLKEPFRGISSGGMSREEMLEDTEQDIADLRHNLEQLDKFA